MLDGLMDTAVIGEGEIGGFIADEPSPKTTANCVLAMNHSRGARFHSSAAWLRNQYSRFIAGIGT